MNYKQLIKSNRVKIKSIIRKKNRISKNTKCKCKYKNNN